VTFKEWLVVTFPGLIEQLGKPEIIAYLDSIEGQMLREIGAKSWDEVKATDERVVDFLMEQVVKLYEEDYEEYPVDPETFLHDPYYLGYNCNRERGITRLWPKLEETFYEVFDPSKGISEVILSGSIGWGKTHFASVCFAYMLYKLSCLKHPQTYYNLAPGSEVVLLNLSVTGDQAVGVFFAYVRNLILGPEGQAGSPYFMENFRPVNKADNPMIFPKNIRLVAGNSQETAAIGQNVVAGFIDEANFMVSTRASKHEKAGAKGGEDVNRGLVLYRAMDRRIKSRFKDTDKDYPGKLFMASSVTYPGDFLSDMIDKKRNDPRTTILEYAHWDTRPTDQFADGYFRVLVGDETTDSVILDDDEPDPEIAEESGAQLVRVPNKHRPDFEQDLDGAIRDIAGIATITILPFMPTRSKIREAMLAGMDEYDLEHPFTMTTTTLQEAGFDIVPSALARQEKFVDPVTGLERIRWLPRRSPELPRAAHFDYSVSDDAAGFAFGYSPGTVDIRRKVGGNEISETIPIVVIEGMLQVVPPRGGEIQLASMRGLVHMLERYGFRFENIGFDQFQSKESGQVLQSEGYEVNWLSVDRKIDAYMNLKYGIYGNRVLFYDHPVLIRELAKLQLDRKRNKVDHPEFDKDNPSGKGSKDVADCVAGVCQYFADTYTKVREIHMPHEIPFDPDDEEMKAEAINDFLKGL
jgi:hypothetical protein